jgi:formylglycine-generating enzyme required for sulfatase activity
MFDSHAEGKEGSMIKIPGGEFKSGKDNKSANVKGFKIDKFEVTFAEFNSHDKDIAIPEGKENNPVSEISYFDAEGYCKSLGKRLPTRLEWEKAARGEDGRKYPWGNQFNIKNANTHESGAHGTVPVGSYKGGKSPYGVMDMSGNVWEWVNAWASKDKKYRIVMGGSYFEEKDNSTAYSNLRSIPDDIHGYIGFRCVK